jgi:hypothetical protein
MTELNYKVKVRWQIGDTIQITVGPKILVSLNRILATTPSFGPIWRAICRDQFMSTI